MHRHASITPVSSGWEGPSLVTLPKGSASAARAAWNRKNPLEVVTEGKTATSLGIKKGLLVQETALHVVDRKGDTSGCQLMHSQ